MSKLSNKKSDQPDNKKKETMPNLLAKGLKGGLLAAVHDSMENLRAQVWSLER